jgi:Cdc6-like AAA superfamily ATPase
MYNPVTKLTNGDLVSEISSIKSWIASEDPNLANVVNFTSYLAHDRDELTCLWVVPYLTRFLKGSSKTMSITGKSGSGKTVLSSIIVDCMQRPIGGVHRNTVCVPISECHELNPNFGLRI